MTKLISTKQVEELVSVKRDTIRKMVREGTFPPPIRISSRKNVWREDVIRAWIEEQTAAA